jgi:Na+-transporting NADH:ubiquinone oxidoreductase subunit NqrB
MSKSYNAIQRRSNFMTHIRRKSVLALLIQTVLLISTISINFRSVTSIKLITISEISAFLVYGIHLLKPYVLSLKLLIPIVTFLIAAFVFSIIFMGYFSTSRIKLSSFRNFQIGSSAFYLIFVRYLNPIIPYCYS